jgi:hypothetical protein
LSTAFCPPTSLWDETTEKTVVGNKKRRAVSTRLSQLKGENYAFLLKNFSNAFLTLIYSKRAISVPKIDQKYRLGHWLGDAICVYSGDPKPAAGGGELPSVRGIAEVTRHSKDKNVKNF